MQFMKKTSSITRTSRSLSQPLTLKLRWLALAAMACACAVEAIAQDGQHGVERALGALYTPFVELHSNLTQDLHRILTHPT
jgi:hypothetical protein